jgi:hypothetical protein
MRPKSWLAALVVSALALMVIAAPARAFAPTANGTDALCNEPSYVEVYVPGRPILLTSHLPGRTIIVDGFTVLYVRGIVQPGTSAILQFRSTGGGFDYFTRRADANCVLSDGPIPVSHLPVGLTTVSVCFFPWETGMVICGPLGYIHRVS